MSELPQDMAALAGPLFVGYLLQWGLFGALSVQVYVYYLGLSNDPPHRKALVYSVYAAELAQTILYTKMAFQEFATGFGNDPGLEEIGLLWFAAPVLTAIVAFVVQMFYAYRIKTFTQSYFIPIVVTLLALLQLAGGIAEGVIGQKISLFSSNLALEKIYISSGVWNGCSAACDLLIAASMTYLLSRRKTPWKSTQRLIQRVTRLIVATGALTAAVSIINLILFVLPGNHPTYYQTTTAILGKMYSNSMMVVLNSRIMFSRKEDGSSDYISMNSSSGVAQRRSTAFGISPGDIVVTREQFTTPPEAFNLGSTKALETNPNEGFAV